MLQKHGRRPLRSDIEPQTLPGPKLRLSRKVMLSIQGCGLGTGRYHGCMPYLGTLQPGGSPNFSYHPRD